MSSRSLNKVILIGNLTRDPELRYTPAGTAVCTFGLATNRSWTTQTGETKEETEFHRVVAWNKLAELCAQLLTKGRKTYVEGRLSTHSWVAQDGAQRSSTEVVIEDMIILDSKRPIREDTVAIPQGAVTKIPEVDINAVDKASAVVETPPAGTPEDKLKEPARNASASVAGGKKAAVGASGKKVVTKKKEEDLLAQSRKSETNASETPVNENITPDDIPF